MGCIAPLRQEALFLIRSLKSIIEKKNKKTVVCKPIPPLKPIQTPAALTPPPVLKEPEVQRNVLPNVNRHEEELFLELRASLKKTAPHLELLETIPSDALARQLSKRWKAKNLAAPLSILSFQEAPAQKNLLQQISTALDIHHGTARLIFAEEIERENQWESFLSNSHIQLILICDYSLWQMPSLLPFYREIPGKSERFLLHTPVFLLPDLSLYLKDPSLKRSLWKSLCQKICPS